MNRWIGMYALLVGAVLGISGCHVYRGAEIQGSVVDSETKVPLSDAIVVAVWETRGGWVHPSVTGNLHAYEARTDKDGHYSIASWGPKLTLSDYVQGTDPTLIVFHANYQFWIGSNSASLSPPRAFTSELLTSDWSGRAIELRKSSGDAGARESNARIAERYLLLDEGDCVWQHMPLLTAELVRRGNASRGQGTPSILPSEEKLRRSGRCASLKDIVDDFTHSDPLAIADNYAEYAIMNVRGEGGVHVIGFVRGA